MGFKLLEKCGSYHDFFQYSQTIKVEGTGESLVCAHCLRVQGVGLVR